MLFPIKIFLLTTCLACLIDFGAGDGLVPGITVPENSAIPQRRELRVMMKDATSLNIYLIALERMQQASTDQLLSFYSISAIHGTNLAWNNDTGGAFPDGSGYCYHAHRLFPTWHRPYLSLYEKTLLDYATEIVQAFPAGTQKNKHLEALKTWRMPYWDWAMNPSLPSVLQSKNIAVMKAQNGKVKRVIIPNPLYSYRLQIPNDPNVLIVDPPPQTIETVRNPTVKNNIFVSRPGYTNKQMLAVGPDLKSTVYDILTHVTDYNSFSNTADGGNSIEGVHGTVHTIVGGLNTRTGLTGHMTYPTYAAFDPIFYLHHANVDRLFAMWQVLNPDSYLSSDPNDFPNVDTELHPFKITDDQYWTSNLARNITAFGYTYPECADWSQQTVLTAVNNLYGPSQSAGRRKRGLISTLLSILIPSTKYTQYNAQVQMSNTAVRGSFILCVFLGEPTSDDGNYTADPNFVGLLGVFASKDPSKLHQKLIKGTVPLTDAINGLISKRQLRDTSPDSIRSYLSQNLRVRIVGDQTTGFDSSNFQIDVVTGELNVPSRKDMKPVWGQLSGIFKTLQTDLLRRTTFLPASKSLPAAEVIPEVDSTSISDDLLA